MWRISRIIKNGFVQVRNGFWFVLMKHPPPGNHYEPGQQEKVRRSAAKSIFFLEKYFCHQIIETRQLLTAAFPGNSQVSLTKELH